jgi:hypothetical protein
MALPARHSLWAAASLLSACTAFQGASGPGPCTGGVCKATITVQACTPTVAPDPIPVPGPNTIEWTIATDGFTFASNGIEVQGTGFGNPTPTPNGKKFTVHDDHTDLRTNIKYTVRVVGSGGACPPLDPFISNL